MRGHRWTRSSKIATMSDDEYETMSNTSMKGDEAFAKRKQGVQKNELNEQLKDYINQWRDERAKEEAELKRLKDKQAARKEIRAEQDRLQAQKKKEEEDQGREEGGRGGGEEEADGGGGDQKAGDDGRPERGRKEVLWSRHGCSQRDVQDQGAG